MVYWRSLPFYAFGLGAASFLDGQRLSRPRVMAKYRCMSLPGRCCATHWEPVSNSQHTSSLTFLSRASVPCMGL